MKKKGGSPFVLSFFMSIIYWCVCFYPRAFLYRGSQGAEGVVTLGETSVLTEFQISNDLLRKR